MNDEKEFWQEVTLGMITLVSNGLLAVSAWPKIRRSVKGSSQKPSVKRATSSYAKRKRTRSRGR